jgi:hypothetical protein
MPPFLRENWKLLTIGILLLVAIGYTAARITGSFRPERPPDWLQQTDRRSPAIPSMPRAALQNLVRKAGEKNKAIISIRYLELGEDPTVSALWTTEHLGNAGFAPLERAETTWNLPLSDLIGYYLLDGTPIKFTTRCNPNYPDSFPVTLHLPKAVAPGESVLIIRRQHYRVDLTAVNNREFQIVLPGRGYPITRTGGVALSGICAGPEAKLATYKPQRDVLLTDDANAAVGWLEPAGALSVTFTRR